MNLNPLFWDHLLLTSKSWKEEHCSCQFSRLSHPPVVMLLFLGISVLLSLPYQAHWSHRSSIDSSLPHSCNCHKEQGTQVEEGLVSCGAASPPAAFSTWSLSAENFNKAVRKRVKDERCWASSPGKARWPCLTLEQEEPRKMNHCRMVELEWCWE